MEITVFNAKEKQSRASEKFYDALGLVLRPGHRLEEFSVSVKLDTCVRSYTGKEFVTLVALGTMVAVAGTVFRDSCGTILLAMEKADTWKGEILRMSENFLEAVEGGHVDADSELKTAIKAQIAKMLILAVNDGILFPFCGKEPSAAALAIAYDGSWHAMDFSIQTTTEVLASRACRVDVDSYTIRTW